jgi:phosphatidylinositol alpha-1,6-mannosyltransferase
VNIVVLLPSLVDLLGGMEAFNRAFVKALDEIAAQAGHRVTVLALRDTGTNPLADRYFRHARTAYIGYNGNRAKFTAAALLHARRADLCFLGGVQFMRLARLLGRPKKFLIVHGCEVWQRVRYLNKRSFDSLEGYLAVSDYTRREIAEHNDVDAELGTVFPNTLDPFYEDQLQVARSLPAIGLPAGKLLLTVSRLDDDPATNRKNIHLAIQAMPNILEHVPDAHYIIVGDGAGRGKLEQMACEYGVADRVTFAGRVSNELLPKYYDAADIFLLPSNVEGFGIVFLEAMRSEKACIGARAGGVPEVIQHRQTGLLVDSEDAESWADAVVELLLNEPLRLAMGRAGRQYLDANFRFEQFRERLQRTVAEAETGAPQRSSAQGVSI